MLEESWRDYKEFQWYGDGAPAAEAYDRVCRDCWPDGRAVPLVSPESVASSDSEAASSATEEGAAGT